MAIHYSISSLLRESITEYLAVSEYCVGYRKDRDIWGSTGCFGYPAAVLLLAIADSIGSYVIGGDTRNHFKILNYKEYYNLNLTNEELKLVYEDHRCLLTHNAAMSLNVGLSVGEDKTEIVERKDGKLYLNLEPFLKISKIAVAKFFNDIDNIVNNSDQINKILNKQNILKKLDFKLDCVVKTHRRVFIDKNNNFELVLDKVVGLGYFMEIEYVGKMTKINGQKFQELINYLNLKESQIISGCGYPDLLMEKNKI